MRSFSIKKAVCTAVVMTMLFPVSGFVLADETVACTSMHIADLKGIEYFVSLHELNCSRNDLISLDLGSNAALKNLSCEYNSFTILSIRNNPVVLNTYSTGSTDSSTATVNRYTSFVDETINYSFSVDKTVFVIGSDFTPGLTDINGTKYYIDENGSLSCSCFITVEGKTYYFGDNGRAATGTVNIDGVTYQFDSRGVML